MTTTSVNQALTPSGRARRAVSHLPALALLFLAACSSAPPAASPRHGSVAVASTARAGTSSTIAAARPADCLGPQLSASVGESGPALGTEGVVILLHNISSSPCWLAGVPSLRGIDRDGHATDLAYRPATNSAQAVLPPTTGSHVLRPGRFGAVLLTECLAEECPKPAIDYLSVRIGLPDGQFAFMPFPRVMRLGSPGTVTQAHPVPAPTGILVCQAGCAASAAHVPTPGAHSISRASADVATCKDGSLTLTFDPSIVFQATGDRGDAFRVTNHGMSACRLVGYPEVTLRDRRGALVPFHYTDGQSQYITGRRPQPVTLGARRWAYVGIAKYRCDQGSWVLVTTLTMTLPGQRAAVSVALARWALNLDYCQGGPADPGNTVAISPIESTPDRILH